jgi:hypothetical protein
MFWTVVLAHLCVLRKATRLAAAAGDDGTKAEALVWDASRRERSASGHA